MTQLRERLREQLSKNWTSAERFSYHNEYYVNDYNENVFKKMSEEHRKMFEAGEGEELKDKINPAKAKAIDSSSMLAYNLFSWIDANHPLVLDGISYTRVAFEVKLSTLKPKTEDRYKPDHEDVALISKDGKHIYFFECKFMEFLESDTAEFSVGYSQENRYYERNNYKNIFVSLVKKWSERSCGYCSGIAQNIRHLIAVSNLSDDEARQFAIDHNPLLKGVFEKVEHFYYSNLLFDFKDSEANTCYISYCNLLQDLENEIEQIGEPIKDFISPVSTIIRKMESQMPESHKQYIIKRYLKYSLAPDSLTFNSSALNNKLTNILEDTTKQIIERCEESKKKGMKYFYKGEDNDIKKKDSILDVTTKEYWEVVCDWLIQEFLINPGFGIQMIDRTSAKPSYVIDIHKDVNITNQLSDEEMIAKMLYLKGKEIMEHHKGGRFKVIRNDEGYLYEFGTIIDYQVPLKDYNSNDSLGVGKIDLLSVDKTKKTIYILEFKKLKNDNDSMLSTVMESYTYFRQVNKSSLAKNFNYPDYKIVPATLCFKNSRQYSEFQNTKMQKLIKEMQVECFWLDIEDFFSDFEKYYKDKDKVFRKEEFYIGGNKENCSQANDHELSIPSAKPFIDFSGINFVEERKKQLLPLGGSWRHEKLLAGPNLIVSEERINSGNATFALSKTNHSQNSITVVEILLYVVFGTEHYPNMCETVIFDLLKAVGATISFAKSKNISNVIITYRHDSLHCPSIEDLKNLCKCLGLELNGREQNLNGVNVQILFQ